MPKTNGEVARLGVLGEASGVVEDLAWEAVLPVVRSTDSPGFEFWFHHLVALGHWVSYLPSF